MIPSEIIPSLYRIVLTDTHVVIFTEWVHDARIVRLNGTHLPPGIRSWLGDSIGHYEGETLVVDTTNFRPDTHNLDSGERSMSSSASRASMRRRFGIGSPSRIPTPGRLHGPPNGRSRATDVALFPVECHEGNYAMENMLKGARAEERRAQGTRP